jgi:Arc/MetJ family transcription regulator
MRTNIVLDDELVAEAFAHSDVKTKRELVDQALREFVARHKRKNLLDLYGKGGMDPNYDYKALRREKPSADEV